MRVAFCALFRPIINKMVEVPRPDMPSHKPDPKPLFRSPLVRDVVSLILSADAERLRHHIAQALWDYASNEPTEYFEQLRDGQFWLKHYEALVKEDAATLKKHWLSRDDSEREEASQKWGGLAPEGNDSSLRASIDRLVRSVITTKELRDIASRVLRYETLRAFTEDLGKKPLDVLEQWENLLSVIVAPVTVAGAESPEHHLHILCPRPDLCSLQDLHATADDGAYAYFYKYVYDNLEDYTCVEERGMPYSGIRSLNCSLFRRERELDSEDDYPAALLGGCRSGVQFPILLPSDGYRMIGMAAIYFPHYDYFLQFHKIRETGFMVPAKKGMSLDDSYRDLWKKGRAPLQRRTRRRNRLRELANLLIGPFLSFLQTPIIARY